jgi:hypothetical protein
MADGDDLHGIVRYIHLVEDQVGQARYRKPMQALPDDAPGPGPREVALRLGLQLLQRRQRSPQQIRHHRAPLHLRPADRSTDGTRVFYDNRPSNRSTSGFSAAKA